jgi:hypothetical protein
MALSKSLVTRFQSLWLKKYDEQLTTEEARIQLEELIELVRLTSRPQ